MGTALGTIDEMKRTIERTRQLPAFELTLADFETLVTRVSKQFEQPDVSIRVEVGTESLQFESVNEMRSYSDFPTKLTRLHIHVSEHWSKSASRSVMVRAAAHGSFFSYAQVDARGDDEGWCAGAVEVVYEVIRNHTRWYSGIRGWPLTVSFWGFIAATWALPAAWPDARDPAIQIPWIALLVAVMVLYLLRDRLMPFASLRISEREPWLKRNAAAITIGLAVLALIVNIIGLFLKS